MRELFQQERSAARMAARDDKRTFINQVLDSSYRAASAKHFSGSASAKHFSG
jgi:hypothetical protein